MVWRKRGGCWKYCVLQGVDGLNSHLPTRRDVTSLVELRCIGYSSVFGLPFALDACFIKPAGASGSFRVVAGEEYGFIGTGEDEQANMSLSPYCYRPASCPDCFFFRLFLVFLWVCVVSLTSCLAPFMDIHRVVGYMYPTVSRLRVTSPLATA